MATSKVLNSSFDNYKGIVSTVCTCCNTGIITSFLSFSAVYQSVFATAVSADKTSYRGADSANLVIIVTELASAPAGQNTSKSVGQSKLMAKYRTRTSGKCKEKEIGSLRKLLLDADFRYFFLFFFKAQVKKPTH